ncbi:MAG TPA: hypothetical protein VJK03_00320 [Candidatus Nanoarchaeia archaeon]|nr:hypothetical protein [Candidatus Nanoarchaeia archaeon]
MTTYKGIIQGEKLEEIMRLIFPEITSGQLEEVLDQGFVPPRVKRVESVQPLLAHQDCLLFWYTEVPKLMIQDEHGRTRWLEFHPIITRDRKRTYEIYELTPSLEEQLKRGYQKHDGSARVLDARGAVGPRHDEKKPEATLHEENVALPNRSAE